jgi:hypothetical protein
MGDLGLDALVKVSRTVNTPSPDARERARRRLAAGLVVAAATTSAALARDAAAGGPASAAGAGAPGAIAGGLAKWAVVSMLIAVGGATGAGFYAARERQSTVATRATPVGMQANAAPTLAIEATVPSGQAIASPAPAIEATVPSGQVSAPTVAERQLRIEPAAAGPIHGPRSLERELQLLRSAQRALDTGSPVRALELLDQYASVFPMGTLKAECQATQVLALCAAGRVTSARQARDQFIKHDPGSPLVERLRAACDGRH